MSIKRLIDIQSKLFHMDKKNVQNIIELTSRAVTLDVEPFTMLGNNGEWIGYENMVRD